MTKRKTTEEYSEQVEKYSCGEFKLMGEYVNRNVDVTIKHLVCNGEFKTNANIFLDSFKCGCCGEVYDLNNYFNIKCKEDFISQLDPKFELVGEYINNYTKIQVKHLKCESIINVLPFRILIKPICQTCRGGGGNQGTLSTEDFICKVYNIHKMNYVILGKYKGVRTKIEVLHKKCKNTFMASPTEILYRNLSCPICEPRTMTKWDYSKFKEWVESLYNGEFTVLGDSGGMNKLIKIRHNICGEIFEVTPDNFYDVAKCRVCENNISIGIKRIIMCLKENGFIYDLEYKYPDCKRKSVLAFDIAVFDSEKNVKCLIEYDGEQHYFPIEYYGGKTTFEENRDRDKIKNEYCKLNKIKLIRIPYWELENIEIFLKNKLKEYKIHKNDSKKILK